MLVESIKIKKGPRSYNVFNAGENDTLLDCGETKNKAQYHNSSIINKFYV